MVLSKCRCPLRLDPHQEVRIAALSLLAYRKAALPLATWLIEIGFAPECETDCDEALIEYKNWLLLQKGPSRSEYGVVIAALDFLNPRLKGHLQTARAALAGWHYPTPIKHTVPM